jgi:uncharacterized protein YacL
MQLTWITRLIRALFIGISVLIGFFSARSMSASPWLGASIAGILAAAIVSLEVAPSRLTARNVSHAVFGLLVGLFCGFLFTKTGILQSAWFDIANGTDITNNNGDAIRNTIEMAINAIFGYLGTMLGLRSQREDFALIIPYVRFRRDASEGEPILLDSNVIIDGRILALVDTGFLTGSLVVPRLILDEVQLLADHRDPQKAARGKRGLQVLEQMRAIKDCELRVHEVGLAEGIPVDSQLIRLAIELNARILTNDENLTQVARLRDITVLNLLQLTRAVQPTLMAGDEVEVTLTKPGKEKTQAVGYLADGAMVVVNDGANQLGKTVTVTVTGTTQTAAGRLVFGDIRKAFH